MKVFNLRNTGILLVIMLVAGAVLVGPASAYAEEMKSSAYDDYWVSALGDYRANQHTECSGYAWTQDGNDAGKIYVKAQILDGNKNLLFTDRDTQYGVQDLEVSGYFYHDGDTFFDPCAKTTMNADNPDDLGFVYAYHI